MVPLIHLICIENMTLRLSRNCHIPVRAKALCDCSKSGRCHPRTGWHAPCMVPAKPCGDPFG